MGGECSTYGEGDSGFLWGKPEEHRSLGNLVADGRIILIWIFRKSDVGVWTGLSWLRIGTGGGNL
jgi:hypothetical protein